LLNQQINIGQFVAAEIIIISIISAVEKIIINLDSAYDVLTAVEKVNKLLDKPIETSGSYILSNHQAVSVEGEQITFAYDSQKPILKDLSFKINAGEKVCICGNNGSGKSTILKLLTGVYKDFDGKLLINNIPIGNFDLNALRANTGILFPQENIFHGTLLENLTMNRPGIDLQYVSQLIMQVGLQSFFASQIMGFETELDPTGKRLSRNVIQKILLIRALANKPALLLMEEPWQGIEEPYKTSIQELLLQLQNTTVIVATQDGTFAERCDQSIGLT
jgi:ABC-type bacteriocin/lantibiotic exporter with double-glycine peptidase domain